MKTSGRIATCMALALVVIPAAYARTTPREGSVPFDVNNPQIQAEARKLAKEPAISPLRGHRIVEDHSGRRQTGKASVYSPEFQGRRMADGKRFNNAGQAAASKTLPLGTVAKVTNLSNDRTAVVTVEDHGPYVDGRTVDLTRATARQIGITSSKGVVPVIVAPIAVPQPDGTIKPGSGALPGPSPHGN